MYQKIMVPLDGSELAECVLPHVESIAKGCGARNVIFVRVVHIPLSYGLGYGETEYVLSAEEQKETESAHKSVAEDYLQQLVSRLSYNGMNLQTEVIVGKVAESLAEYAEKNAIDLIIIATHGRSGVSRWVRGSIADRVLHSARIPVLMVRAPGCIPGT